MVKVNENYLKLPGSYLFSTIGKKVREFSEANPDKKIIRLGIGDVTSLWHRLLLRRSQGSGRDGRCSDFSWVCAGFGL